MKTIFLLVISLSVCLGHQYSENVKYQWNFFNFTWPSSEAYTKSINDYSYIPQNVMITGIRVWKDRMYLTFPRFKNGVPVTLASIPLNPVNGNIAPILEPFPNWDMQKLDDCKAFQYVQSMEIDVLGRMWILENGRTELMTSNQRTKCPARLVIVDLENNSKVLLDYKFPRSVVNMKSVHLNDIVLDHEDGGYAYITDSDKKFPGIIVFSLEQKTSWKVTHESMKADEKAATVTINGTTFTTLGTVNGIALSPASTEGNRTLFYTPFSCYNLYSVPVNQLKNNNLVYVTRITEKSSQNGGMVMSSDGHIYYGNMNQDAIAVWDTNVSFEEKLFFQDHDVNQYPDSFDIGKDGYLYWTSNRLQKLLANQKLNIREPNFRILFSKVNSRSYQYYQDESAL